MDRRRSYYCRKTVLNYYYDRDTVVVGLVKTKRKPFNVGRIILPCEFESCHEFADLKQELPERKPLVTLDLKHALYHLNRDFAIEESYVWWRAVKRRASIFLTQAKIGPFPNLISKRLKFFLYFQGHIRIAKCATALGDIMTAKAALESAAANDQGE